jgi:hypothetical protein
MKPAAILALACSAAISAADYKDVDRTLPLPANGFLDIETHKGSLHVSTWNRQDVEIHARIEAEPGTLMDRRRFDGTDVHIDSTADSVHIKTYYPDFNWCCTFDNGNNPEVRYTIKMPKTARLTIRDHRSEIDVAGLAGALNLTTTAARPASRDSAAPCIWIPIAATSRSTSRRSPPTAASRITAAQSTSPCPKPPTSTSRQTPGAAAPSTRTFQW